MNSQEITEGLRQNDRKTIKYVYSLLGPVVCRHVSRNSGTVEDGKDVFQETFIKVLKNIRDDIYRDDNFEAYFIRIAENTWKDTLRKKKVRADIHVNIPDDGMLLIRACGSDEDALLQLILKDKLAAFDAAWVSWNNTICQRILNAFHLEEKSHQDIADTEGWGVESVGSHLSRCRKKLFKFLGGSNFLKQF